VAESIRIGYSLSLTGPVAGNSRSAQLSHEIWQENVNDAGGLLSRPVELVCYDDQANAEAIPHIYTKLLDDDKVDLVIGGYGTANLVPAMPLFWASTTRSSTRTTSR
jgi:branched-chain amino acid transport system substrate-binding protein